MKKVLYYGRDSGLYIGSTFKEFMINQKAEPIIIQEKLMDKILQVWMLNNVGIRYSELERGVNSRVAVTLFGELNNILNVEKIILNESKRYS